MLSFIIRLFVLQFTSSTVFPTPLNRGCAPRQRIFLPGCCSARYSLLFCGCWVYLSTGTVPLRRLRLDTAYLFVFPVWTKGLCILLPSLISWDEASRLWLARLAAETSRPVIRAMTRLATTTFWCLQAASPGGLALNKDKDNGQERKSGIFTLLKHFWLTLSMRFDMAIQDAAMASQ